MVFLFVFVTLFDFVFQQHVKDVEEKRLLHSAALSQMEAESTAKFEELELKCAELQGQADQVHQETEEWMGAFEEEVDREIWEAKSQFDSKLREENVAKEMLDNEKKKVLAEQDELTRIREDLLKKKAELGNQMNEEKKREQDQIKELDASQKEIEERLHTIEDKERRIYNLNKKNQVSHYLLSFSASLISD